MLNILNKVSLITSPVGVNVFVLSDVARDVPMNRMFRWIVPFWFAMMVCIILLVIFPEIVMFLPNSMN